MKDDPIRYLSPKEIEAAREQLRRGAEEARRVLNQRGVVLRPRIVEARARAAARKQTQTDE